MSDYLPPEVLMNILTRLPVESILRCTCVCKEWYSLITTPTFITTHLNGSSTHLLVRHCIGDSFEEQEHYSLHSDDQTFTQCANLTFPFTSRNFYFRIIGISNGLVFLSDDGMCYTHIMILWNPSIRKFVTLPRPNVTFDSHGPYQHSIGFGFLPATNDYKIVRLVYLQPGDCAYNFPPEVEIYELSTGSWRSINARGFSYYILERSSQAFLNGVVHWIGFKPNRVVGSSNPNRVVVSFDMKDETFSAMKLPICEQHGLSLRFALLGDLLSLMQDMFSGNGISCCIWVMAEYGIEKSWTKQFTIDLTQGNLSRPIGFRGNGDVLLSTTHGDLVSYNPKSKQSKNLGIHGNSQSFYVDIFIESLVLLEGLNRVLGGDKNFSHATGASSLRNEENEVGNQENEN